MQNVRIALHACAYIHNVMIWKVTWHGRISHDILEAAKRKKAWKPRGLTTDLRYYRNNAVRNGNLIGNKIQARK